MRVSLQNLYDGAARFALRCAYRVIRLWRKYRRPTRPGTAVAVWYGGRLLLVRHSYRKVLSLPGGGVGRRETPVVAACRELREEVGIAADPDQLSPVSQDLYPTPEWETPQHVYEFNPRDEPRVRIDNREIIEARFTAPHEAKKLRLGPRLRAYIERCPNGESR